MTDRRDRDWRVILRLGYEDSLIFVLHDLDVHPLGSVPTQKAHNDVTDP